MRVDCHDRRNPLDLSTQIPLEQFIAVLLADWCEGQRLQSFMTRVT
jgi:hypothetical protein